MRRSLAFLVPVLAMMLVLGAMAPATARQPLSLGVASENSTDMGAVVQFKKMTGAKPRLWTLWSTWGDRGGNATCVKGVGTCAFPMAAARGLKSRGITPVIWWQPTAPGNEAAHLYGRHRLIMNGTHDAYIRQWAKAAKRFGKPVIVRFAHEMNGNWFEWGLTRSDNTAYTFKKAWQHIVKKFRKVGAKNVKFLWSPYPQRCGTCAPWPQKAYYPGGKYVDYVGVSVLNWGAERGWKSMVTLVKGSMYNLRKTTRTRRRPMGKPVILPEVGSNYHPGDKAAWIRNGYKKSYKKWPNLRAIVYFDYDTTFVGQPDWRLVKPDDGSAIKAYRSVATKRIFSASIP